MVEALREHICPNHGRDQNQHGPIDSNVFQQFAQIEELLIFGRGKFVFYTIGGARVAMVRTCRKYSRHICGLGLNCKHIGLKL